MTTLPKFEIPAEMRDFAIKGVDQARKAFDAFVGAAQKAAEQAEKSPIAIPAGVKELNAKVMTIAQTNAKAAFDHAEALVKAADPQEALALQRRLVGRGPGQELSEPHSRRTPRHGTPA